MEIVKVKSLERGAREAFLEISKYSKINIALTGGNFGMAFVDQLVINQADLYFWKIFFTDERITTEEINLNSFSLCKKLNKTKNFQQNNVFAFNHKSESNPYSNIARIIDFNKIEKFDITMLSLGEDGHLAGHFYNSAETKDPRFCYTNDAPKLPKKRISFNVEWLKKSSKVILAVIGANKSGALRDLVNGDGLHSGICNINNLMLITDIDI